MKPGAVVAGMLNRSTPKADAAGGRRPDRLRAGSAPRITRAQSLDVLSSQATMAG